MIPKIVTGRGISGALAYVMGQGNDAQTGKRLELVPGERAAQDHRRAEFWLRDRDAADLDLARRIMEYQGLPQNQAGKTRKLDNDCYHASLSWGIGQDPTHEEMLQAGQEFLKAVGLEKARAVLSRTTTPTISTFTLSPAASIPRQAAAFAWITTRRRRRNGRSTGNASTASSGRRSRARIFMR